MRSFQKQLSSFISTREQKRRPEQARWLAFSENSLQFPSALPRSPIFWFRPTALNFRHGQTLLYAPLCRKRSVPRQRTTAGTYDHSRNHHSRAPSIPRACGVRVRSSSLVGRQPCDHHRCFTALELFLHSSRVASLYSCSNVFTCIYECVCVYQTY